MATLKKMHKQDYLEFVGVKTNFPDALNEYLASSIEPIAPRYEEFNSLSNTLKDEKTFTYRDLYYLFESVAGNKLGCVKLRIGQTSVTRQTHRDQCASNDKTYQTVFIWENDACRTCKLGREGLL